MNILIHTKKTTETLNVMDVRNDLRTEERSPLSIPHCVYVHVDITKIVIKSKNHILVRAITKIVLVKVSQR